MVSLNFLSFDVLKAIDDCFRGMNNLRRWTEDSAETRYNEISKQALNFAITYVLAKECEYNGEKIIWERFPKIAIFRGFQKMGLADVTHSTYVNIVEGKMNCKLENFHQAVGEGKIRELIKNKELAENLIHELNVVNDTREFHLYKLGSKIATLIELIECKDKFDTSVYAEKYSEICAEISKSEFKEKELLAVGTSVFKVFQKISTLRNQNRWAVRSYRINCSVLGHLFDTAVFAYLISLNKDHDKQKAAMMFFMGIWHDVAETWTKDIPSPTKDAFPGFREASEEYELECLDKNIYEKIPEHIAKAIKEVMMEEEASKPFKKLMKAADYLSADSECWRNLVAGSRDAYFRDHVLLGDKKKVEADPNTYLTGPFKKLLDYYVEKTELLILLG